jgi:hypothetical protein
MELVSLLILSNRQNLKPRLQKKRSQEYFLSQSKSANRAYVMSKLADTSQGVSTRAALPKSTRQNWPNGIVSAWLLRASFPLFPKMHHRTPIHTTMPSVCHYCLLLSCESRIKPARNWPPKYTTAGIAYTFPAINTLPTNPGQGPEKVLSWKVHTQFPWT